MHFTARGCLFVFDCEQAKAGERGSSAVAAASSGGEANELNDEVAVEHNEPKKKVTAGEGVKVARRAEATTATSGGGGGRYLTQS